VWQAERSVYLVVGATCVQVGEARSGQWQSESLLRVAIDSTPQAALAGLNAAAAEVAGSRRALHVLVSERWLRVATLPWSDAMRDASSRAAYARSHLADGGYADADDGELRVDVRRFGEPAFAVEYGLSLLEALHAVARRWDTDLRSVLPLGVAAWRGVSPARAAMATDGAWTTLATGDAGHAQQVVVRHDPAGGKGVWQRMQLRDPLLSKLGEPVLLDLQEQDAQGVSRALLLGQSVARVQGHALDAVVSRPPTWHVWALAAGLAVFAASAAVDAMRTRHQAERIESEARVSKPVQAPLVAALSREEAARVPRVNAAIRELNMPIDAVLRALQPPADLRVALLSLELAGSSGVRIAAETRSTSEMVRYAAFVGDRKPFVQAHITHHERDMQAPERPYRFTMEASWSD
jgi:hypothetical protein